MLVLYETSLGYCLFKLSNDAKVSSADIWKEFETPESANGFLKLRGIHRFSSIAVAVEEITAIQEGKLSKGLKQFLSTEILKKGKTTESLAVMDAKLGKNIEKKLDIQIVSTSTTQDLYRGIRSQIATLLDGLNPDDFSMMNLGLSHSLSRYKLKFSPDKVDTMVIQSIALLDDLDKEINIYAMRVKEWYGWHFPELAKLLGDNLMYSKVVKVMGLRTNASSTDLSDVLPEDLESAVKIAAEISMGTEIAQVDIEHIHSLCDQVIEMTGYRTQLADYLRNRMNAIAPNLTALVGELVGARLISHAGSLMNLAKHPASTVQILGAEKALFRALKTKHDTPKYGLIYHASLVGQAPPKLKGKMARMVATKAALSIRVDALTDIDEKSNVNPPTIGLDNRAKLESRLRALEHNMDLNGLASPLKRQRPVDSFADSKQYNPSSDATQLLATDREPRDAAVGAVLAVKEERRREKKERRKKDKDAQVDPEATSEQIETLHSTKEERRKQKRAKKSTSVEPPAVELQAQIQAGSKRLANDMDGVAEDAPETRKKKKKRNKLDDVSAS